MLRVFVEAPYLVAGRPVGGFAMNQYVIVCPDSGEAAIVDSGGDPAPFVAFAEQHGAKVTRLLQTHAHVDHVAGLAETKRVTGAPVFLHPEDAGVYAAAPMSAAMFGMRVPPLPAVDEDLNEGDTITFGGVSLDVIHTPGHCPGHVCFIDRAAGLVIAGDLLFQGSVGRTDLPGAAPEKMGPSLSKLFTLPDETRVFPGHMGPTTIGAERSTNPFLDVFGVVR